MAERTDPTAVAGVSADEDLKVERALLTVSDKRGLVDFARVLSELGIEIVSTGGTAQELDAAGIETRPIEDYTGFPEILDGRVKTLHPKIYAGLLAVRSNEQHLRTLDEQGIEPIDLIVVNLYPFERMANRRGSSDEEVIENIDIGGPTLIRAAAKNSGFVAAVVRPESYDAVAEELKMTEGLLSAGTRETLATEAFGVTARYDAAISRWFSEREDAFPQHFVAAFEKVLDLSYGENPHQRAAYYEQVGQRTHLLARTVKMHGKDLSYNNLLDLDSGRWLVREFEVPGAAIVKHNNPCGCAIAETIEEAYESALSCDPQSAFGSVVVLNRKVTKELAQALNENFVELLFAPGYDEDSLEILQSKPNIRIIEDSERRRPTPGERDMDRITGGLLMQDRDTDMLERSEMQIASEREPTEQEWGELQFAWKVCKHVRSNAIVIAKDLATIGIGAGQMSRIDSVQIAINKAHANNDAKLKGSVLASDAFFPFSDGPEAAIEAGVTAIIQPGGSKRDAEVVQAASKAGVAMVFTDRRHFRH
ncbi:MAG: bifunctional phosphoribosylaminoimidazolecarboxamide formyltransferase/IMP cyclohydrolase [Solirubrobacterales bacterium]